jgi:hypothetical protein
MKRLVGGRDVFGGILNGGYQVNWAVRHSGSDAHTFPAVFVRFRRCGIIHNNLLEGLTSVDFKTH